MRVCTNWLARLWQIPCMRTHHRDQLKPLRAAMRTVTAGFCADQRCRRQCRGIGSDVLENSEALYRISTSSNPKQYGFEDRTLPGGHRSLKQPGQRGHVARTTPQMHWGNACVPSPRTAQGYPLPVEALLCSLILQGAADAPGGATHAWRLRTDRR